MKLRNKIIVVILTIVTLFATLTMPTFAAEYDTINFCGSFSYGTLYNVGDTVAYHGNLYTCIIKNAISYPTDSYFWEITHIGDSFNYDQGHSDGYDVGYDDGFTDGVNEQIHVTITPTLAHFENAVIELYRGTKPPQTSNRYHTETVVSTTSPTNIFDMLYVPILDTTDVVYDGYTMTITFDDVVHFGENPFCLYLDTEDGYEFNLNDYLTVSFMSSSDEHFNVGDCFYTEGGYYYYIPSKYIDSGDIDMVRITMKFSLFSKLKDTSFSETTNRLTIVNKPYNVGIISGLILDRYYSNGYDMGYEDGNYDGYTEGKTSGYQLGYDEGYNLGYLASEGGEGFSALFDGIAHVPVTILTSLLGFEVFGINIMSVLIGLLTILVVVFVIKRFI